LETLRCSALSRSSIWGDVTPHIKKPWGSSGKLSAIAVISATFYASGYCITGSHVRPRANGGRGSANRGCTIIIVEAVGNHTTRASKTKLLAIKVFTVVVLCAFNAARRRTGSFLVGVSTLGDSRICALRMVIAGRCFT